MINICNIDMSEGNLGLQARLDEVWGGDYDAYHICNVPETDYVTTYENLAEHLGGIKTCHAANDTTTKFSKSRDIRPDPNKLHYFCSHKRQPLHSDYAYYDAETSADWLMLYCLKPSKFGGQTHLLTVKTLVKIMEEYEPELLERIKTDIVWEYTGVDGDKIHTKPLFDGININWNYFQIKNWHNSREVCEVREDFYFFLEQTIVAGNMYDYSKKWKSGDCIIFNDHTNLHGRDAFLGDRWLKDHAIFNSNK